MNQLSPLSRSVLLGSVYFSFSKAKWIFSRVAKPIYLKLGLLVNISSVQLLGANALHVTKVLLLLIAFVLSFIVFVYFIVSLHMSIYKHFHLHK